MFGEEKSTKTFLLGSLGPLTPSVNMVSNDDTSAVVAMKILINPLGWKTRERGEEEGEKGREKETNEQMGRCIWCVIVWWGRGMKYMYVGVTQILLLHVMLWAIDR